MLRRMTLSPLREIFRIPTVTDKLNLFQRLLDLDEIHADLALALLKAAHSELSGKQQGRQRSAYRRYAGAIEALRYRKTDLLHHVANSWKTEKPVQDPEWLQNGKIK